MGKQFFLLFFFFFLFLLTFTILWANSVDDKLMICF